MKREPIKENIMHARKVWNTVRLLNLFFSLSAPPLPHGSYIVFDDSTAAVSASTRDTGNGYATSATRSTIMCEPKNELSRRKVITDYNGKFRPPETDYEAREKSRVYKQLSSAKRIP